MSKEKEILDKTLTFNYGDELDKIQNHISTLRFVAVSSVNSLEEQDKENKRLNNIINELEKWLEKEQVNSVDLDEWTIIQVRDKILELRGDSNGKD